MARVLCTFCSTSAWLSRHNVSASSDYISTAKMWARGDAMRTLACSLMEVSFRNNKHSSHAYSSIRPIIDFSAANGHLVNAVASLAPCHIAAATAAAATAAAAAAATAAAAAATAATAAAENLSYPCLT